MTRPRVVDADAHVVEGPAFVLDLMGRFPDQVGVRRDGVLGVVIEGRTYPDPEGPGAGCPSEHGLSDQPGLDATTAGGILANADTDGINEMVLFPSFAMCVPSIVDPTLGVTTASLYNEWAAALVAEGRGRLHAAGVVPIEHGARALEVLAEIKALGLVCVVVPPALAHRNLDHPDLDRFYAAAAEMDMALGVHGAPGIHLPKIGVDRFTNYIQVHCISFPFDQMTAMTAMVSGGVFDRHPGLRVAFLEAGVGWVPFFIDRLHEHFEKRGDWIEHGWQRDPQEYVRAGNIFVTCEPEEPILPGVIDVLGDDFIMFASDYPHWDGEWPESTKHLRTRPDISENTRAKIGGLNAQRFYGLN